MAPEERQVADPVRSTEEILDDYERRYWTGKCGQWWHPARIEHIRCGYPEGHEGPHYGYGLEWANQCGATEDHARKFIRYYRCIPNNPKGITLRDDGIVEMNLWVMHEATAFIGVVSGDD